MFCIPAYSFHLSRSHHGLGTDPCQLRRWAIRLGLVAVGLALGGCRQPGAVEPLSLKLHQQWQLPPGEMIGNARVTSGLGDLVLDLDGQALYMPKAGRVEPLVMAGSPAGSPVGSQAAPACVAVSSPEIPAYKLRLCHLHRLRLGPQPVGAVIGRGKQVAVAMLRKQPEGTWAFVEPAPSLLEALVSQP